MRVTATRRVVLTRSRARPTVRSSESRQWDSDEEQATEMDERPQQGALFDDPSTPSQDDVVGYRGPTACSAAGITYRQLDYCARTSLVVPTIRTASGSGTQRLYSF